MRGVSTLYNQNKVDESPVMTSSTTSTTDRKNIQKNACQDGHVLPMIFAVILKEYSMRDVMSHGKITIAEDMRRLPYQAETKRCHFMTIGTIHQPS